MYVVCKALFNKSYIFKLQNVTKGKGKIPHSYQTSRQNCSQIFPHTTCKLHTFRFLSQMEVAVLPFPPKFHDLSLPDSSCRGWDGGSCQQAEGRLVRPNLVSWRQ